MRVYRYGGTYNITCVFMCMRIPSFNWVNVAKNVWFAPAKRPRCYPVRVLGFDQPDFQGFTNQSSRIFCQSEHWGLFFQLECWGFTSRSAGVLPDGVLRFFTSRSAGVLPAGVLEFLPAGVLGFYQPECWSFTSQSARVLPAGVLGCFIQPVPAGVLGLSTSQNAGVLPAGLLRFYQP